MLQTLACRSDDQGGSMISRKHQGVLSRSRTLREVRLVAPDAPVDELGERRARRVADLASAAVTMSQRDTDLLDCKAWELLGLTGAEFQEAWLAGCYVDASDRFVGALERLILTRRWHCPPRHPEGQ